MRSRCGCSTRTPQARRSAVRRTPEPTRPTCRVCTAPIREKRRRPCGKRWPSSIKPSPRTRTTRGLMRAARVRLVLSHRTDTSHSNPASGAHARRQSERGRSNPARGSLAAARKITYTVDLDIAKARGQYDRALALDPGAPRSRASIRISRAGSGRPRRTIEAGSKAVQGPDRTATSRRAGDRILRGAPLRRSAGSRASGRAPGSELSQRAWHHWLRAARDRRSR